VQELLTEPGSKIPVGTLMALLRGDGEPAAAPAIAPTPVRTAIAAPAEARAEVPMPHRVAPTAGAARPRITPVARRLAGTLDLDISQLVGHGLDGAITLADVQAAAGAAPARAAKPSRSQEMRNVIAAAMARSKREIPHYYLTEDIAFERAARWLAHRNEGLRAAERLLPAALLVKAVAGALLRYPEFNGFWKDGAFVTGAGVHIGVAVSLRDGGLVAPALHDVPALDIATLTRALLDLVKRTRAGALRSSELSDATITVTNLGDQGVASVLGVIYPPQVALIGFGRVAPRAWATDDGVRALPALTASLAADHRASDGHRGALLLAEIRDLLQAPDELDRPLPPPETP
jgi:pyruvate dehydrogenase E2 component (dihydrolipoamide acetyltransferase)